MNTFLSDQPCAKAIVEQTRYECVVRWHFVLKDAAGIVAHEGLTRMTKLEAMADRTELLTRATDWRDRAQAGYADAAHPDAALFQLMLRSVDWTRDPRP